MARWIVTVTILIALGGAAAARAESQESELYGTLTAEQMAAILQDQGYRAVIGATADGLPEIESGAQGRSYWVYLYDCNDETPKACTNLTFFTYIEKSDAMTLEAVNDWNLSRRFGRAYLDQKGNANLSMDIDLIGGVTRANLEDWLLWWDDRIAKFNQHMG